jgi:hypothetical protein
MKIPTKLNEDEQKKVRTRKRKRPGSGKDPEREFDGLAKRARFTLLFAK